VPESDRKESLVVYIEVNEILGLIKRMFLKRLSCV
jgi:hypothetical protein